MLRAFPRWLAVTLLVAVHACAPKPAGPAAAPLAAVSPVAAQKPPVWIVARSPSGIAKPGAQIRIRFANDVVPLETLEAPDRQQALSHLRIEPALPGRFLFLTPRMAGFEADAPLPSATRVRVTLTAGLADLRGNSLANDFAWSFETEPLQLTLAGSDEPQTLTPTVTVGSNAELDAAALAARVTLRGPAGDAIALVPKPRPPASASPSAAPDEQTGPDEPAQFAYELQATGALAKATAYRIEIAPGVAPLHGNVPTTAAVRGKLHTYAPLALTSLDFAGKPDAGSAAGRFAGGAPVLRFNNGIEAASAAKAIALVPAASNGVVVASDGEPAVTLSPYALEPNTHYTVAVAATLTDRFGQTLGTPVTRVFDTGRLAADLWAPEGFTMFPVTAGLKLDVSTTNLPGPVRTAYRVLAPEQLIAFDPQDSQAVRALLPPEAAWTATQPPSAPDRTVETQVDVRGRLGAPTGMLAYGMRARTNRYVDDNGRLVWAQPAFDGVVALTNIGLFAQWFPDGAIVRTHHLSDGGVLPGAQITIYPSYAGSSAARTSPVQPCAGGTTDAAGTLVLGGGEFAACSELAKNADEAPALLAIARSGADWTFVRTDGYSGAYQYGQSLGWSAGKPQSHGTIVSDRDLYQPGETAYLTGIAYFDTNGRLARGRAASYELTLFDPSGGTSSLGSVSPDAFGAFNVTLPLAKDRPVGNYSLHAEAPNGEQLFGSFRVAEFKPPNFKVALTLDRQFASPGDSVNASWSSEYLFGAPVEGGDAKLYVTRTQAYFTPDGWDAFSFGRTWLYPEEPPTVASDVLQTTATVPAGGRNAQTVAVANDLPYPMTYEVDAQTSDVSNLSVSDSKTFMALPSDALIGLESDFVARASSAFDVQAIVTDPRGKPVVGRRLHLTFAERQDLHATQAVENTTAAHDSVHYAAVAQTDVTSGSAPVHASFTPSKPGTYRVRANFSDAASDATASDAIVWASGAGEAAWGPSADEALPVKLDKPKYRPGEIATALVQSPYADAELFFAVVRHGVLYQTTQQVSGAAPQVRFRVTEDMLPNAAVEAVLVRRGAPLERGIPAGLEKLSSIGFAPLSVALDSRYLKIAIRPEHAQLEPAALQHVRVHLTDAAQHPVRGEVVLAVVNDAILQLSGYRYPDLVQLVYEDQPISTRLGDNRALVSLASPKEPSEKGFGYGGGLERGAAGTRVRTQFKPIAYFAGALKTDANGDATATFAVPDDLTTWRTMAMAFSSDVRFGTSDATFVATKALVTNAIVPQFARPGDRLEGGVAVTNPRRISGKVAIDGTLSGSLAFATGGATSQTVSMQAPLDQLTQAFRFAMTVDGTQVAHLKFATALGSERDAFDVPLEIRTADVTESVVTAGTTTTSATVPLAIDPGARRDIGGLEIELASTLLPETREAVAQTLATDDPFATNVASRLAAASDAIVLARLYGGAPASAPMLRAAQTNLTELRALGRPDGGFAEWPGASRSDLWTAAFCARALARARTAGIDVGADVAGVSSFLHGRLADPSLEGLKPKDEPQYSAARLEALGALASLGEARTDFLGDIAAQGDAFDFNERSELARVLIALPAWHAKGLALRDKLLEQVHLTGRNAAVNEPAGWYATRTAGQAALVGLLVASRAAPEITDAAVRSLLDLRRNGAWPCPCDNAEALGALVDYARSEPAPPNFTARAALPGTSFGAQFRGFDNASQSRTIPAAALPSGKSTVTLAKTGMGTLHYVVAYRYGLGGERPGVYAGVRLERILREANARAPLAHFGLATPVPLTVVTGRVFEIEDRITTDHSLDDALVTDPLPAGFEAVDTSFQTATKYFQASADDWQIDYQAVYRDRVLAFAKHLDAGVYAVHYLVRSVTPGTFAWPAAEVHPQYAPEDFGRTAAGTVTLK